MSLSRAATALILVLCGTASATVPDLSTRHVLTLDAAKRVITAAEAEAKAHGWPCVVAVTDAEGYLIALDRMDASPMLASVELAPAKARTAALFRKPTKALEDTIHNGRIAAVTAGFVEMIGGLPLTSDDELIGAIGVSSAQPDWDAQIAAAGAAALEKHQ
jgi:glc operon protein GlcG